MASTIRNPIEWGWDLVKGVANAVELANRAARQTHETMASTSPDVRKIGTADIKDALKQGWADFGAYRTDVVFMCIIYPVLGLVLARLVVGEDMIPLLFPLASGFAIIGPFAAVGLYEMSRQREAGIDVTWANAFSVIHSPAIGAIFFMGLILMALFLLWLVVAWTIYATTLGVDGWVSPGMFVDNLFTTSSGAILIVAGCGVGLLFAVLAMAISVVSFPLLLDRDASVGAAIKTSCRVVMTNPVPMAMWGVVVAGALVLGSIPLFIGLVVVMPVLGHATWHLYRKVVVR